MKTPRLLRADEIECRIQMARANGSGKPFALLLLYKDARCDMNILDETYGVDGWQRDHKTENGNLFGGIGIWDDTKNQWIWKWDAGKESNQDAEKGHASDAFKRAGFNWGIGRELYSAPKKLFVDLKPEEWDGKKATNKAEFFVQSIEYNEKREIAGLVIVDKQGVARFRR